LLFVSSLKREDLLNTAVEKERDVGIFLGLCNVDLLDSLCTQCLCENITHVLRLEGDGERVVKFVLSHGRDSNILWVREIFQWRTIDVSEQLGNFPNTIRSVVEEEYLIAICGVLVMQMWNSPGRLTFDTSLLATNNDRLQELVVLSFLISFLDRLDRITALLSITNTQGV
jgi:hypothetical protein